ncbi:unnamed protein product [Symbiodinium sp. CCMP2456]|nr:unnamed protein product [Symbiodinium sp. CCMP2456]
MSMARKMSKKPSSKALADQTESQAGHLKTLWELLTKSALMLDGVDDPAEWLEYRHRNLQWRTGLASGAHGEVSDLVSDEVSAPPVDFCSPVQHTTSRKRLDSSQMSRCASWPTFDARSPRKIWMLSPEMESDLKAKDPRLWQRLQTQLGLAVQAVTLLLVVGTYAACPLTVSWAKIVGHSADGVAIKGRPFKEGSVIVASWLLIATVGLLLSAATGGRHHVRRCFDLRSILTFAPAGIGWAMADACEVMAVARMDPATYGVLSQGRLLSSAAAAWVFCGLRQSGLQWGILACLSLICMAYCMTPDESRPNAERLFEWRLHHESLQITATRVKCFPVLRKRERQLPTMTLAKERARERGIQPRHSQVCGRLISVAGRAIVYVEMCFKSGAGEPMRLHVQMTQVSFSSIIAATTAYLFICGVQNEDPTQFFSGQDGSWSRKTMIVAAMYCWREWICSLCVKHFDSLVKNICNAASLVVTYGFTVLVAREKDFSVLKAFLLLAIVMEVINYCYTRRVVKQPKEEIPVAEYSNLYLTGPAAKVELAYS